MVDKVLHFLGVDFQLLRLDLAAIDDSGDAATGTERFGPRPPGHDAGGGVKYD